MHLLERWLYKNLHCLAVHCVRLEKKYIVTIVSVNSSNYGRRLDVDAGGIVYTSCYHP